MQSATVVPRRAAQTVHPRTPHHPPHQPRALAPPRALPFLNQALDRVQDPILRAAIKEPVAFWGGLFAGALRLNVKEDPLKTWVERTGAVAVESLSHPPQQQGTKQDAGR